MKKTIFIVSGVMLFIILLYLISGIFLIYKKTVNSPYVLLEDWISYSIIEDASNYIVKNNIDSVFVVGMKNLNNSINLQEINKTRKLEKKRNTYAMYWSGILGFEIPTEKLKETFTLHIKMRGTRDIKHFPHYKIFVNKQLISTGFVNETDSVYEFNIPNYITDSLTYILINFDNDIATSQGDRNLYISDIYINTMNIEALTTKNFFISDTLKTIMDFVSNANNIKNYLKDLGYDSSKVKLIEVNYDSFNKTLALAKGAKIYFSNSEVKNINIITAKNHSRRSFLNFKNCLEKKVKVGCIPRKDDTQNKFSLPVGIDERISLILTWIYWWFH